MREIQKPYHKNKKTTVYLAFPPQILYFAAAIVFVRTLCEVCHKPRFSFLHVYKSKSETSSFPPWHEVSYHPPKKQAHTQSYLDLLPTTVKSTNYQIVSSNHKRCGVKLRVHRPVLPTTEKTPQREEDTTNSNKNHQNLICRRHRFTSFGHHLRKLLQLVANIRKSRNRRISRG